jgi:hypothetical protein
VDDARAVVWPAACGLKRGTARREKELQLSGCREHTSARYVRELVELDLSDETEWAPAGVRPRTSGREVRKPSYAGPSLPRLQSDPPLSERSDTLHVLVSNSV